MYVEENASLRIFIGKAIGKCSYTKMKMEALSVTSAKTAVAGGSSRRDANCLLLVPGQGQLGALWLGVFRRGHSCYVWWVSKLGDEVNVSSSSFETLSDEERTQPRGRLLSLVFLSCENCEYISTPTCVLTRLVTDTVCPPGSGSIFTGNLLLRGHPWMGFLWVK